MNTYEPYTVTEDTPAKLHLAESPKRKTFLFIYFRIFPVLLVIFLGVVYNFTSDELPPQLRYPLLGVGLLVAILFVTRRILNKVEITPQYVTITYGGYFETLDKIPIYEISHIRAYSMGGRGGGQFFFLVKNTGGEVRFLTIPIWYMEKENFTVICNRLMAITGLEVREK